MSKKRRSSDQAKMWVLTGGLMGLTALSLSLASVPELGRVTDDTALYQDLSEIRVQKQRDLNFDGDIDRLSSMEARYAEKLPALSASSRTRGPMARISSQSYRYSGSQAKVRTAAKPKKVARSKSVEPPSF